MELGILQSIAEQLPTAALLFIVIIWLLRREDALDKAKEETNFCLMGFCSTHPLFPFTPQRITPDKLFVGINWLDGNCIFSQWQDNIDYGVLDASLDAPLAYFVELEYAHRMRYLTSRPIVLDGSKDFFYEHVFRRDKNINKIRSEFSTKALESGNYYWNKKFGYTEDSTHCGGCYCATNERLVHIFKDLNILVDEKRRKGYPWELERIFSFQAHNFCGGTIYCYWDIFYNESNESSWFSEDLLKRIWSGEIFIPKSELVNDMLHDMYGFKKVEIKEQWNDNQIYEEMKRRFKRG